VSRRFPKAGLKPLLHTSGMVLALTVMASVSYNRMSAGGHNWDSLVNTLHARASSITDAMVKQRDFLSDARTKLVDEIAKLEKSKDSPDQLQANQAMLNEVDRSIATYTELRNEQKKLDEEIAALATSHESGRKLEDKFAEITKKNEELFFSVLTPQNRQTIADAAGVQIVTDAARIQGPIWPVFLAGAAFLYLWWLSALTFDLTFVWHLYIRYDLAERYFDKRLGENEN
jgi:phage-related tail protein